MKRTIKEIYEKSHHLDFITDSHVTMQKNNTLKQRKGDDIPNMEKLENNVSLERDNSKDKEGSGYAYDNNENLLSMGYVARPPDNPSYTIVLEPMADFILRTSLRD